MSDRTTSAGAHLASELLFQLVLRGTAKASPEDDLQAMLGAARSVGVPERWRTFDSGRPAPDWVRSLEDSRRGR
jgi:hypothetical protein